ncbi:cytochrome P450 [Streptomyces sp. B93]|uniref:cytochrome P450 family protein n=1 Tax=Streptomyces sp. B93 TaxID=2824875 RepID=UPI001B39813C|nr:cytochrome P450 [Streptomyces sp. B93]MBQ1094435.1 cytochrome P450 [Streptomyces sp. B93]
MTSRSATPVVLDPTGRRRHAEHRLLRAHGSAVLVDILGVRAWSVTDPDVLKQLLTSSDVSKDARTHWPRFGEVVQRWPLALWIAVHNMFTAYGTDHRRLRRLVAPAFSHHRIARLTGTVEDIVTALVDDLATHPAGAVVDLRERLAHPLPMAVISHLMGVPGDQRGAFRQVVDGVFDTTFTPERASANTAALYQALDRLIATRRSEPGDDMTSLLIATRDDEGDGRGLTETELRDTLLLMISAGYQTTVDLIDQAVTLLLTHPRQLAHIREGRAGWNDAVEETLRLEPPVTHLPLRYAVTDIELPDGQVIARHDAILASYAAANRHPGWHGPSADAFDVTRAAKDHLAFGHGVHFCLGAPLARLEAATALKELFTRFRRMELGVPVGTLVPLDSLISNGHRSLPVRLTPPSP